VSSTSEYIPVDDESEAKRVAAAYARAGLGEPIGEYPEEIIQDFTPSDGKNLVDDLERTVPWS
jgi:hypothetical protein